MANLLRVFVDESGNFDFSLNGTRYFVLSAVSTPGCPSVVGDLHALKHEIACDGADLQRFHAAEDRQDVRNRVFGLLKEHVAHRCFGVDAVVVQKNKTNPSIRDVEAFYPKMLKVLLQYVLQRSSPKTLDKILVWTDQIEFRRKRRAVEKAIKLYLANELKARVPYHLYHHSSSSEPWLQVADYCGWTIYKKWTDGELRPYREIQECVRSEFDIFAAGTTVYY